jgi:hypothetical protein
MRYVIYSPPYRHNSAGIRVLYELAKYLIRLGEDAYVVNAPIPVYDDEVLILPEIADYSSFGALNTVRYYLNKPIKTVEYNKNEFNIKYNDDDHTKDTFKLTIDLTEPFFTDQGLERNFITYYVGKGEFEYLDKIEVPNCRETTMTWPPDRKSMAHWLNVCSELYCYDDKTALTKEALMCGCKVYLVKNGKITQITDYPRTQPALPQVSLFNNLVKERFPNAQNA